VSGMRGSRDARRSRDARVDAGEAGAAGAPPASTPEQRTILVIAILGSVVSFLDGTLVNVALPAIGEELGGGLATQQWVVDAYLITLGALILVAGSLSDLFGRLRILVVGLVVFGVASVAVGAAPNPELLIAARALQGVGGALLVPSSLALITSAFRGAAQGRAIGLWTAWTSAGTLGGPVLGGLFVDLLSWRWAFFVNVLPIAVTLVLIARLEQRDRRLEGTRVDVAGAILAVVGLGGTVFALIEGQNLGWGSPAVLVPAAVGVVAIVLFLVRQRTASAPLMPLDLWRRRNFWVGNLSTVAVYGALSLGMFALTVFLQQEAGYSATLAGIALLPSTVVLVLFSSLVGRLNGRFGPRFFMTAGPIVAGLGFLWLLLIGDPVDYWLQLLPGILLFGVGLTLTVSPLTSAILGAIETSRSGIASAVNNAVSRIAGLIATAMVGIIAGSALDLGGLHRAVIVTAALLIAGGVIAFLGIRNEATADAHDAPGADAADADGAAGTDGASGTGASRGGPGTDEAPAADADAATATDPAGRTRDS